MTEAQPRDRDSSYVLAAKNVRANLFEPTGAVAIDQKPSAMPLSFNVNVVVTIDIPTGISIPPPTPSMMRQKISSPIDVELPHINDPNENIINDNI